MQQDDDEELDRLYETIERLEREQRAAHANLDQQQAVIDAAVKMCQPTNKPLTVRKELQQAVDAYLKARGE